MTTSYEVVPAGQGSAMHPGGTLRACGRVAVGYTADQMRAYAVAEAARAVAAERERISKQGAEYVDHMLQAGDKAGALRGFLLALEAGA